MLLSLTIPEFWKLKFCLLKLILISKRFLIKIQKHKILESKRRTSSRSMLKLTDIGSFNFSWNVAFLRMASFKLTLCRQRVVKTKLICINILTLQVASSHCYNNSNPQGMLYRQNNSVFAWMLATFIKDIPNDVHTNTKKCFNVSKEI